MDIVIEQINSVGKAFVDFAWPMLWQASVLIVILLAADWLLRRKVRAVFRYWLWMLVLVKLFLPTTLTSPVSIGMLGNALPTINIAASERPVGGDISNVLPYSPRTAETGKASVALHTKVPIQSQAVTPVVSLTREGGIFLAWLMVVCAMLLLLMQRAVFVFGLVRQSAEATGLMNDALKFCCNQMGVRQTIGLKISPNATSPAVCGLFRPVILVPQGLGPSLGIGSLRVVLMHELTHIKRGDLWVNLLQTVLQIAYFYNPLLWVANWVIRRVREQAVDEAVQVALGEKASQYPETLLNVARLAFERPALSLRLIGVVESKGALTSRIKRMLTRPVPKTAKLGIIGSVALILLAAVLLPMAKAAPPPEFVIKGTVTDAQTGKPVAGAKVRDVERYAGGKYGAVTDSEGNYSYKTWYEEHNVKCEAAGYKTETKIILTKVLGSEREKILDFAISSKMNSEDRFKAALSNGVKVELVGICEYPPEGKKWWRADGKEHAETFNVKETDTISAGGKPYAMLIKTTGPNDKSFWVDIEFSYGTGSLAVTDSQGHSINDIFGMKVFIDEQHTETNVKVNVSAGPWTTSMSYNGVGIKSAFNDGYGTVFSTPQQTDKGVVLVVSDNSINCDSRVVAIDDKNVIHTGSNAKGGTNIRGGKSTQMHQTTAVFRDIALNKIKEFQFQTRPYEQIEFKNVSLRPGVKTNVQVEVEGSQAKAGDAQPVISAAEFGDTHGAGKSARINKPEKTKVESEAGNIDLLKQYPTTLTGANTNPQDAREWQFISQDIYSISRFSFDVNNTLHIKIDSADLGIGHCKDGAVWAVVIPREHGTIKSSIFGEELIDHLWLRFHPGEVLSLFPKDTVIASGDKNLWGRMNEIARVKMNSSWQAGGRAMIPAPKDFTVDADTKKNVRRFFVVDSEAKTAEYVAAFEGRTVPAQTSSSPVVVKTTPETFANDVSSDLNNLTVTFNQQMKDKSWAWVQWDAPYPETTGQPYYDNEKKTCSLPVKLKAGQAYLVAFNVEPYIGFVNSEGKPAKPYVLVFATKGSDGKPTPIPEDLIIKAKSINDLPQEISSEAGREESKAESVPYTQITYDDIRPDGTILFKNTIREINRSNGGITNKRFINSDFVHVTGMSDDEGRALEFKSTHDGNIYRYEVTFNKPIPPGQVVEYTSEGTMDGLVKPVAGSEKTFQYYMTHSPAAGQPTRRVETYLLPAGAELISTTPEDMKRQTKDGRIELHVEKMIPIGGSITTSFKYRMP